MSTPGKRRLIVNRVVVAIDASTEQLRTLEAAADLAALMQAELHGLFVRDPNLMRLEKLPGTRKIELPQGFGGQIKEGSIRREVEAMARRVEQLIARASEQRHINWSFHSVEGVIDSELTSRCGEGDLLVTESAGRSIRSGMRMKPQTRRAPDELERPVLYLQGGPRQTRSIVAVYDGGPDSEAVLDAAVRLFGGPVSLLTVLLAADSREEADELREEAESRLSQDAVPAHYRRISPDSTEWILHAIDAVHGDILIQGAGSESLEEEGALESLLEALDCPMLLIR